MIKKLFIIVAICLMVRPYTHAQTGKPVPAETNDGTVYTFVEHPPKYTGGNKKLSSFLTANIDFSKVTTETSSYAVAIGKTGQLLEVKKLKGLEGNESALLAALNKTNGKWSVGKQNGHPVNVSLTITIELANKQATAIIVKPTAPQSDVDIVDNQYERGKFKDGYKTGVWEYYDKPGELALKINYTTSQILYLKPDTSWYAVKINDDWETIKPDIQPRYIGSMNDFAKIHNDFHYPKEAFKKPPAGKFFITFEVDTIGQAGNYTIIDDIGSNCADSVVAFLQSMPNYWIVAKKDGKRYVSRFIIPVTFSVFNDGVELISEKKESLAIPPVAKQLYEIVIRLMGVTRLKRSNGW